MARKRKQIQHHPIVGQFAERLRTIRRKLGLSQFDLSMKTGMALTYCGKLERGECAAGIDTAARLAETLGVSVATLVGGRVQSEPDVDTVSKLLRQAVDQLLKRDNGEQVRALAVIVAGLNKGSAGTRRAKVI